MMPPLTIPAATIPATTILATTNLTTQYESLSRWTWVAFAVLAALLFCAIAWVIYRRIASSFRRNDAEMMILRGLESSSAMTDDEKKKIRAALARKYMEKPQDASPAAPTGLSPLQALAIDAQRLEEEARARAARSAPPPDESAVPPTPSAPPEVPVDQKAPDLPPMIQKLMSKSDIELEDLVAAGLITEEDLQWVRRARGGK